MKKTTMKKMAMMFSALAILFITSCSETATKEKNPVEKAEDRNDAKFDKVAEKDAQSLLDAYNGSLYEQKVAESAQLKATSREAKDLAVMLAEMYANMNNEIRTLAGQKEISLPADLSPEQSDRIVKMNGEKGITYDKDFVSMMVDTNKDAVELYKRYSVNCTDGDVKSWFAATIAPLQKHLDMAVLTKEKIDKMK